MSLHKSTNTITLRTLRGMKSRGEKIACLTAYDASFAQLLELAGIDVILVGDSLGMVIQGHATTLPVTMDSMVYHMRCVSSGCSKPMLIADMPFMSYSNSEQAVLNAARLMQEGGAHMVKLEGGVRQAAIVQALSEHDIPVCAHLGLQPQAVHKLGGFRTQGRDESSASSMYDAALALQESGADMLLLECVPSGLAARITESVNIPVIGIGAGVSVDGQVLVLHDMLGVTQVLSTGRQPRFVRNFMQQTNSINNAVVQYIAKVRSAEFPSEEESFE